jgi:hypothetical protein
MSRTGPVGTVTGLKRLLKLYNRLLDVSELPGSDSDNFYMGSWIGWKDVLREATSSPTNASMCYTVACIAGWATSVIPEELVIYDGLPYNEVTESIGYTAFAQAFGLDLDKAEALCQPDAEHRTSTQAAAAVLKLAKQQAKKCGYEIVDLP